MDPSTDEADPKAWERTGSQPGPDLMLFRARTDRLRHPRSGREFDRLVLETPAWCNVVTRTGAGDFVLVRQFRFGTQTVTTEIPGGMVDPGEAPLAAAQRELREETGFEASRWSCLGVVEPNAAFQDNLLHMFLAEDAQPAGVPTPDEGEDIRVVRWSEARVLEAVQAGEIRHSLVLCALARVLDLRQSP